MPESALLTQIISDYCASNEEYRFQQAMLEEFGRYAAKWLVDNGCLGMGHAATGLTLRFADGRELSLFSVPETGPAQQPAVPISSTKDKLVVTTVTDKSAAVQITGRQ